MIHVIGIGVDGRQSLSEKALGLINRAGLVVGGTRHLAEFNDINAAKLAIGGGLDLLEKAIKAHIKKSANKSVAVIATGDPLFFGIGAFIIKKFGKRAVNVIPNVSVVQEAFSRIKESADNARVFSAHGRAVQLERLAVEIAGCDKAAAFTDDKNNPAVLARSLLKCGQHAFSVYVFEALGTDKEKISNPTLQALCRKKIFAPLNIVIFIKKSPALPDKAVFTGPGVPDVDFVHLNGMITKEEIRVVSLAKLRLTEQSVVWDIGSCSGSVAIEAAFRARRGRVYAIEKNPARVRQILKNKKRFNAHNVEVLSGVAPACLGRAPEPDAVFIGGGGAKLTAILDLALKRIKKGGRIVVNAVTMETASVAFGFFKRRGIEKEMLLMNLSKAHLLDTAVGSHLFKAYNPVFIITGVKQ